MNIREKVAVVQENIAKLPAHNKSFAESIILFFSQEARLSPRQVMVLNQMVKKIEKAQKREAKN